MDFDFLTANDKPALLGLSTPEIQETAKTALDQLGYKVHTAVNHGANRNDVHRAVAVRGGEADHPSPGEKRLLPADETSAFHGAPPMFHRMVPSAP